VARRRFDTVYDTLAAGGGGGGGGGGTVTIEVVHLQDGETLEQAISRADAAMYASKHNRGRC
jgi:GGDEF domain-containing protein